MLDFQIPRIRVLAILIAVSMGTALAGSGNDAGSGSDAGDSRDMALLLPGAGTYQARAQGSDQDWFRLNGPGAPQCVKANGGGDQQFSVAVSGLFDDQGRTVGTKSQPGKKANLGLAIPNLASGYVQIKPAAGNSGGDYSFGLSLVGVPPVSAGDALTSSDAGNSISTAISAPGPCIGGHLVPVTSISDPADVYAVSAAAGDVITYSLATDANPALTQLSLLDSSGSSVASSIASGGVGTFSVPMSGTYFLSITRLSGEQTDVGYLLGVIVGPPDDSGPGCRPYC